MLKNYVLRNYDLVVEYLSKSFKLLERCRLTLEIGMYLKILRGYLKSEI